MTGLRRSVNKSFMTDLFLKLGLGKPSLKIKTFKMENVETPETRYARRSSNRSSQRVGVQCAFAATCQIVQRMLTEYAVLASSAVILTASQPK